MTGLLGNPLGRPLTRVTRDYVLVLKIETNSQGGEPISPDVWTTVPFTRIVSDESAIAQFASNRLTLPPGKYRINALVTMDRCWSCQLRLRDVVNGVTVALGSVGYLSNAPAHIAEIMMVDVFTLYRTTTLEMQAACEDAGAFSSPNNTSQAKNPHSIELLRVRA